MNMATGHYDRAVFTDLIRQPTMEPLDAMPALPHTDPDTITDGDAWSARVNYLPRLQCCLRTTRLTTCVHIPIHYVHRNRFLPFSISGSLPTFNQLATHNTKPRTFPSSHLPTLATTRLLVFPMYIYLYHDSLVGHVA